MVIRWTEFEYEKLKHVKDGTFILPTVTILESEEFAQIQIPYVYRVSVGRECVPTSRYSLHIYSPFFSPSSTWGTSNYVVRDTVIHKTTVICMK